MRVRLSPWLWALVVAFSAPTLPVGAQEEATPVFLIEDPHGDVEIRELFTQTTIGSPVGPATIVTDPFDLTRFSIAEDAPDRLVLGVEVADLSIPATYQYQYNGGGPNITVEWSTDGAKYALNAADTWYLISSTYPTTLPQATAVNATLCARVATQPCVWTTVRGNVDFARNTLYLVVPKVAMLGTSAATGESEPVIQRGSELRDWMVTAKASQYFDQLPNDGSAAPSYNLAAGAANARLAVKIGRDGEQGVLSVPPGGQATATAVMTNEADVPVRATITAHVVPSGPGWDISAPKVLEVPAKGSTRFGVHVSASADLEHLTAAELRVQATDLANEDVVGYGRISLEAAASLASGLNVLHYHAAEDSNFFGVVQFSYGWMNVLHEDGRADLDEGIPLFHSSLVPTTVPRITKVFPLDSPVPSPIVINSSKPVTTNLAMSATAPVLVTVRSILSNDGMTVAEASKDITIGPGLGTHEFTMHVNPSSARIRAGDRPTFVVVAEFGDTAARTLAMTRDIQFHPGQSTARVHAVPDVATAQSALVPGLRLEASGDLEGFVAPGSQIFLPFSVLNERGSTEVLELRATPMASVWTASIEPSERYRLAPGEGVDVAVALRVPEAADEEMTSLVFVNASYESDPDTVASLVYSITVTSAAPPTDADVFDARPETLDRALRDDGVSTPGVGVLGVLVAMVGVMLARRRFRKTGVT